MLHVELGERAIVHELGNIEFVFVNGDNVVHAANYVKKINEYLSC